MPAIPPDIARRYLKVKRLEEEGVEGERDTAAIVRRQLEEKYPALATLGTSGTNAEYEAVLADFVRKWNQRQREELRRMSEPVEPTSQ